MLKKVIKFTDFNGVEKEETHYFTLTRTELIRMTMSEYGAMDERMKQIVDAKDSAKIMDQFYDLLRLSYGVKTADGRFVKKENGVPVFDTFETTAAYDAIFMELITDPSAAADFARGILPEDMRKEAEAQLALLDAKGDA